MLTNNNLQFIRQENLHSLKKRALGNFYFLNGDNEMQKIQAVGNSSQNKSVIIPLKKKPEKEDAPQIE